MEGRSAEGDDADLVRIVESRRARGFSVAAACREVGISTSTYYRKRRSGSALAELAAGRLDLAHAPPATVGLLVKEEGRSWPFTAQAPFYWDQVFADELSDSFVRREFGRGASRISGRGALTALASIGAPASVSGPLRRIKGLLGRVRLQQVATPLAAAAFFALVTAASVWMVYVAADPAAWIDPGQTRIADRAVKAAGRP